jgi:hypothetical protein
LQTHAGTYRHTTHPSSIIHICYPYHPFFGQRVQLVRRIRHQPSDSVIIALPDGLEIAIPSWMLDPLACEQIKDACTPSLSTDALLVLDELLQNSGLIPAESSSTSGSSQAKGVSDGPESFGPSHASAPSGRAPRPQSPARLCPMPSRLRASHRASDLRHAQRTEPGE